MKNNRFTKESTENRKILAVIGMLAMLLGILPGSVFAALPESPAQAPSDPSTVYLPILFGPAPSKSSFELIEEALRAGELDAETALIYQVYAITLDLRLPAKYRGVDKDDLESNALREAVRRWDSLSTETQALLAPFLTPPAYEGSWANPAPALGVAEAGSADEPFTFCWEDIPPFAGPLPGWERLITAHTTIWYQTIGQNWPDGTQLATPEQAAATAHAAAAVIEHIIQQETGLMGRWPIFDTNEPCNGGDGSIDIYIMRRLISTGAQAVPYPPGEVQRPGYIWLAPDYADGDPMKVRDALAHEFFHLISLSYPQARELSNKELPEYEWLDEATANWMVDYVYEDDQFEHEAAPYYLNADYATSLEMGGWGERGTNGYSDYVFLQFLDLKLGPQVMRAIWENTPTLDSLAAINEATKGAGGFETLWPEFALVAWNDWENGFLDDLYRWDLLEAGMSQAENTWAPQQVTLGGKRFDGQRTFSSGSIEHVAIGMSRHVFGDPAVRSVLFTNPLVGVRGAHIWALLKIGGEWQVEDWTEKRNVEFCRQLDTERVEEIVVIVTNSVFDDREYTLNPPVPDDHPRLEFTNVACGEWQGTITTMRRMANEAFEHWETTETNVTFVRAPERTDPAQGGTMAYKVMEGSTTRWSGYESYNGCQTLPKQVDVPIPADLSSLTVVVAAPESELSLLGWYLGRGWIQHEQQMDYVCTWGSGWSDTWYQTNEWWPYPQSSQFGTVSADGRVMEGQLEQMDGDYTVTANWRLETVGP